ncbi:excitatory amino acid transporter 1-like isoform X2 [Photinus pyralis]|nr:excitatory amino acid transporter 1-like isoform X2 [Photinus pyralis]
MYVKYPGDLFLRVLKSLIIPLLTSSIVSAIGSLDLSLSKKIAARSIIYYTVTTFCAVVLGIVLVTTIRPGVGIERSAQKKKVDAKIVLTADTLMDLGRNMFPPNIIEATVGQTHIHIKVPKEHEENPRFKNDTYNLRDEYPFWDFEEVLELRSTNILGLVVYSIIIGIAVGQMGQRGAPLVIFFDSLSKAMMIVTGWIIWLSPIGVFFLVVAQIMEIDNFATLLAQLGFYFGTVLLGLFIHGLCTLTVVYFLCTRTLPFKTIGGLTQALATAFGTASSSATMPISIQALDDIGVDPRVTRFVIPIGAMCNLDGTALYEAVAAIFIAQRNAIPLGFGHTVAVCLTATAASIGGAGIPQAGLVTMVMVLDTVGLPADQISLILAVDWLLDRFRTTINVMGDCLGARIVDILSKNDLKGIPETDKLNAADHELVEIIKDDCIV